jgi:antitoxin ParD1/3/4
MNISITPELERFVEEEVQSGLYQSASEVIRAGLRRLKEDKDARGQKPRFTVSSMAELENKLLSGVRQLDRGEGIPGEVAYARLKARAKARGKNG